MHVQVGHYHDIGGHMLAFDLPTGHVSESNHQRVRELYFYYYYCHHLITIIASIQARRDWS